MLRTKPTLLLVLLLVGASIVAVGKLQSSAAAARDAEVTLAGLRLDLAQIQQVPWGAAPAEGYTADEVRKEMKGYENRIRGALTALDRDGGFPERETIAKPFGRTMLALNQILDFSAAEDFDATGKPAGVAGHQGAVADQALAKAAKRFRADGARALKLARYGATLVILLLFGAFAAFYGRSARARRRAERLEGEKRILLEISQKEALTDALTGLGNRRAMMADLEAAAKADEEVVVALFDLDGFKPYNDKFGHPAGDALLVRLSKRLTETMDGIGGSYRMGGDEFCIIARNPSGGAEAIALLASTALSETGPGFEVTSSYGIALMPAEAEGFEQVLQLADQRLYENKISGRPSTARETADVLLTLLSERSDDLARHTREVAALSERVALRMGIPHEETERIRIGAELHDIGKAAIPDSILNKPGELDADEERFLRRHTLIGERIVQAAPSLAQAASLVRSSHERFDGTGYPDGLSGTGIRIGARIIAACDAFNAMVSDRPYQAGMSAGEALAELRLHSGTQFDGTVVDALDAVVAAPVPR